MLVFSKTRFLSAYALAFTVLSSYLSAWLRGHVLFRPLGAAEWLSLHERNAARIVSTFHRLRGIYIKIGQLLSMMGNFLPEELTARLESLQDNAPPTPIEAIYTAIEREFKKSPDELFSKFSAEPLATASLGQVHEAILKSGERVAVKVQHPYIEELVHRDLRTLKKIFFLFHLAFPRYGIYTVYRECAEMIRQELNFRLEGEHCEALAANLKDMPQCLFPKIYWDYCSPKILTAEFMQGIKISRLSTLSQSGIDRRLIATTLLHAYCRQIFVNGLYHADPHPGNLLVQVASQDAAESKIVFLDFGATAKISKRMQAGITRFVEGLIRKDSKILNDAMKQMGFVAKGDTEETSERIVDYFYRRMTELNVENVLRDVTKLKTLSDLISPREIDFSFRELATTFHIPREWVILERTLLILGNICSQLDPDLNPAEIVLPYVETFVLGKGRKFHDFIVTLLKEAGTSYLQMGVQVTQTLKRLERGEIAIKIKGTPVSDTIYRSARLLASTMLFAASAFFYHATLSEATPGAQQGFLKGFTVVFALITLYLLVKKR